MPREVYDAEGNAVDGIPDEEELKTLRENAEAKAILDTKVAEAQAKLDTYEKDPAYKNFGLLREKVAAAEKERDEWKEKADKLAPKNEPQQFSKEELEKIADERSEKKYQEKLINSHFSQFGDKKEVVRSLFIKLSAGENLTDERIGELMQMAANGAGLNQKVNPVHSAIAAHSGGTPKFDDDNKSFADTEEGKARAKAFGFNFKA